MSARKQNKTKKQAKKKTKQKNDRRTSSTPGTSLRGHSGDRHETRLVGENKPRIQDWERISSMVRTVLSCPAGPAQQHPTGSSGDPACLSQNCFCPLLLTYAGKLSGTSRNCFPFTSLSQCPITSWQFSLPLVETVPQRLSI